MVIRIYINFVVILLGYCSLSSGQNRADFQNDNLSDQLFSLSDEVGTYLDSDVEVNLKINKKKNDDPIGDLLYGFGKIGETYLKFREVVSKLEKNSKSVANLFDKKIDKKIDNELQPIKDALNRISNQASNNAKSKLCNSTADAIFQELYEQRSFSTMIARFDVKEETSGSLKKFREDIEELTHKQKEVEKTIFETKNFILDFSEKARNSLKEYAAYMRKTKDYVKEIQAVTKEIGENIIQEYQICMGQQRRHYYKK